MPGSHDPVYCTALSARELSSQVGHLKKEAAAQDGQIKELQRALRDLDATRDSLQEEVGCPVLC